MHINCNLLMEKEKETTLIRLSANTSLTKRLNYILWLGIFHCVN